MIKKVWENFRLFPLEELKKEWSLRNFQQYSIFKCLQEKTFVIGLPTGLGKTVCSYAVYFYYRTKFPKTKLIVVTNKSAVIQFERELEKFFNYETKTASIYPKMGGNYKKVRENVFKEWGDGELEMIFLNYAIFRKEANLIVDAIKKLKKDGYNIVVVYDECSKFKSLKTQTFKAVKAVASVADKVIGLTATLTKGKLEEIYGIFKGMRIPLFSTKSAFMERYCVVWQHPKIWYIQNIRGYKNMEEFKKLIEPYCVILKKSDVAEELPPIVLKKIYLEHSKKQVEVIRNIYDGVIEQVEVEEVEEVENKFKLGKEEICEDVYGGMKAIEAVTECGYLKGALLDDRLVTKGELDVKIKSPKTEEIIRMLEEDFVDEKIIIYTHSRVYLNLLVESIEKNKNTPENYEKILKIHGGINALDRQEAMDKFSKSKKHNLIVINDAGLESINLQAAGVMIVTTLPRSGGDLVQLAGRFSRLDSKHLSLLLIFLLMKDSMDEDDYLISMQQIKVMENIMGEPEKGLLDYELLAGDDDIEKYKERSKTYLLFQKRSKRSSFYKKARK